MSGRTTPPPSLAGTLAMLDIARAATGWRETINIPRLIREIEWEVYDEATALHGATGSVSMPARQGWAALWFLARTLIRHPRSSVTLYFGSDE